MNVKRRIFENVRDADENFAVAQANRVIDADVRIKFDIDFGDLVFPVVSLKGFFVINF